MYDIKISKLAAQADKKPVKVLYGNIKSDNMRKSYQCQFSDKTG